MCLLNTLCILMLPSNDLKLSVKKFLLFLVVCVASVSFSSAQHLGFKQFTVDDGLSQTEVVSLFQDSRGFLWAGTKFGVSQFDGHKFVTRFDSLGILKSSIRHIEEIENSSVIAFTSGGYVIFEPKGKMHAFKYPFYDFDAILSFWVDNSKAYISFKRKNKVIILETSPGGPVEVNQSFAPLIKVLETKNIRSFIFDKKYDCYYLLDSVYSTFCFSAGLLSKLEIPSSMDLQKGKDGNIYKIAPLDYQQAIRGAKNVVTSHLFPCFGLTYGIFRLSGPKSEKVVEFKADQPGCLSLYTVSKTGKIILAYPEKKELHFYDGNRKYKVRLQYDGLDAMFFDDENTLWMGTANGLLHVFPDNFINFSKEEGLYPNTQSLVADNEGKVWIGSYDHGLQYYYHGKLYPKNLDHIKAGSSYLHFYPGGGKDHWGRLHFCMNPFPIMTMEDGNAAINFNYPPGSSYCVLDDTANRTIFYGTDVGLIEHKYGEENFKVHPVFPGNTSASKIVSIVKSDNGDLLLGGFRALIIYNGTSFEKLPNSQHPDIPGANTMVKDNSGNIWIGNGSGIYLYNNKQFYKIKNDFFNGLVLSLYMIDRNRLFIGGQRGIGILDLKQFYSGGKVSITYYDKNNGFIGGECQQNCVTRDADGYLWIGGSNGIVRFDATSGNGHNQVPRAYITKVFSNKDIQDWSLIPDQDFGKGEIELTHKPDNIRFEFTGILFSSPANLKFSYILEGFDKNWSEPSPERNVTYTNLAHGRYVFKVKAISDSGVGSVNTSEFKIRVVAPFWQRWYFYLFLGILVAALIVLGVSQYMARRTRKIREHLEAERRFAELQFKTLRNQLAPHFIFNALNAIGSSIYQNEKEKSYDFLQRFASLIRSTLIHADKSYRTLGEELEFVRNYLDLEQFRFENKFDYQVTLQDGIDPGIAVPKMIIQTFAENAVKHGLVQKKGKGHLTINLSPELHFLKIEINDNGIGMVESQKYNSGSTGKGMEIIKEFIDLFNRFNEKKIEFEILEITGDSGQVAGTNVIVKLPIDFTYSSTKTLPHESV